MNRTIASVLLLIAILGIGGGLAAWKYASIRGAAAASANQPEPIESVTVAVATERAHRPAATAIGTVLSLRSVTLRNELPGTVRKVLLKSGEVVEAGSVLVALDVSVEEADLKAQMAQAELARTSLERLERLREFKATSEIEVDRARAERDVAVAQIARTQAIIERKTVRVPFKARVGIADVHPGQYLNEGTALTTLQSVDDAVHVDFTIPQDVATGLRKGDSLEVFANGTGGPIIAKVAALDARVDPATRNIAVRARIEGAAAAHAPAPGSSVRVSVGVGAPSKAVAIPASALRKGPAGDHVFVLAQDKDGKARAQLRVVQVVAMLGDEVLIQKGLAAGEQVAASGSFKLRDAGLVGIANAGTPAASRVAGGS
jgi:membrane fusion protein (multidrug efflux system)